MNFPPPEQPARDVPHVNWRQATGYEAAVVIPAAEAGRLDADLALLAGVLTSEDPAWEAAAA